MVEQHVLLVDLKVNKLFFFPFSRFFSNFFQFFLPTLLCRSCPYPNPQRVQRSCLTTYYKSRPATTVSVLRHGFLSCLFQWRSTSRRSLRSKTKSTQCQFERRSLQRSCLLLLRILLSVSCHW